MKSFKLNPNSWHTWLYNFGRYGCDKVQEGDTVDICSYIRGVVFNSLLVLLIVGFLTGLGAVTAFSIGNVIGWMFFGYILEPGAVIILGAYTFLVSGVGFVLYKEKRDIANIDKPKAPPGFVKLAYTKFKDKTCFKLQF